MPEFTPVRGHCQCGRVVYTVNAPAEEMYHCHCSMCRRCHGTVYATYATVAREHVVVDAGLGHLATFDSSPEVHRHFCRHCGCQLLTDDERWPHLEWFTPGTLEGGAHPGNPRASERHIFVGSKLPWLAIADGLPQIDEF